MKIGILGGGQLAKMLSLAAYPMGISTLCYEPVSDTCATQVTDVINGSYEDAAALNNFAGQVDVITFETENITPSIFETIHQKDKFCPNATALLAAQDRLTEKQQLNAVGIPTAEYCTVESLESLQEAVAQLGLPCVLKTRRGGYDGKGQFVIKKQHDVNRAWEELGQNDLILEGWVPYDSEVSIIAARNSQGDTQCYPVTENFHREGILRETITPFSQPSLQPVAVQYVTQLLQHWDYIGVIAIEFFVIRDKLIANEVAPRVHNTGHWTIEGAVTSQFENHIRAISGLPLGSTQLREPCIMVNMIGHDFDPETVLALEGVHYHAYGKAPRPNRKLGHVTAVSQQKAKLGLYLKKLRLMAQQGE